MFSKLTRRKVWSNIGPSPYSSGKGKVKAALARRAYSNKLIPSRATSRSRVRLKVIPGSVSFFRSQRAAPESLQLVLRMGSMTLLSGNQAQGHDLVGPHR